MKVYIAILITILVFFVGCSPVDTLDRSRKQHNKNYPTLDYQIEASKRLIALNIPHRIDENGELWYQVRMNVS